jgi:hypothetical protein
MTEHLLVASDTAKLILDVPFVCKKSYDIGNFALYPTYRGFSLNKDGFLNIREEQNEELPSLLQEWLYFGLLQEFLGPQSEVNVQEFVRTIPSTEQQVLDTTNLPPILQECRKRLSGLKKDNR